jgi:hypothetical protein
VVVSTSGTLRDYRRKHKGIDAKHAVRRWGKDILLGLQYLHSQVRLLSLDLSRSIRLIQPMVSLALEDGLRA